MKILHNEKLLLVISICMTVLFAAAIAVAVMISQKLTEAEEKNVQLSEQSVLDAGLFENERSEYVSKTTEMNAKLVQLEGEYAALEKRYNDLLSEQDELQQSADNLSEEVARQLEEKQAEIDALKESLKKPAPVYKLDVNAQYEILKKLDHLLTDEVPKRKIRSDTKNGEIIEKEANVAVYYEDIENGYAYSFNKDYAFYSASCIKAPFALSILQRASQEVNILNGYISQYNAVRKEGEAEYSLTNLPGDLVRVFNFDKKFVYTSDKDQPGTGKIRESEDGTEYTYLELIEYMLKYSDNVGYNELKREYGTSYLSGLSVSLKTTAMKKNLSKMSAEDAGKVMKAVYEYIESDDVYSDFLYKTMTSSAHSVMISRNVSPARVAHKYGWDKESYCDIAIVYDTHPYVIAFMSDLDQGGDEVNDYISEVVTCIRQLHANFYALKK